MFQNTDCELFVEIIALTVFLTKGKVMYTHETGGISNVGPNLKKKAINNIANISFAA